MKKNKKKNHFVGVCVRWVESLGGAGRHLVVPLGRCETVSDHVTNPLAFTARYNANYYSVLPQQRKLHQ